MSYIEHPSPWLALGDLAIIGVGLNLTRLQAVIRPASGRLASIDGLRGILALNVFFHHFFIAYQWKRTGTWSPPPTHLYSLMGSGSVTLFFMITGFLFFGRIKATRGALNLNAFFAGRLFRLMPVYLLSLVLIVVFSLHQAGARWSTALQPSLDGWLLLQSVPIAGYADSYLVNAGVHWTLTYEWIFYLALPLLALLWVRLGCGSWALLLLSVGCLWLTRTDAVIPVLQVPGTFFAPFALGGLAGELGRMPEIRRHAKGSVGLAVCVAGAVAFFLSCEIAYSVTGYLLLMLVFTPIALGNTVLGVLRTRTLMMLGEISYDVYLLHGIVLFALYTIAMPDAFARAGTPGRLFSLLVIASVITVAAAVASHLLVERPALRLGRKLIMIDRTQELAAP